MGLDRPRRIEELAVVVVVEEEEEEEDGIAVEFQYRKFVR